MCLYPPYSVNSDLLSSFRQRARVLRDVLQSEEEVNYLKQCKDHKMADYRSCQRVFYHPLCTMSHLHYAPANQGTSNLRILKR